MLLVAGGSDSINMNPFSNNQESLSVYIYSQAGLASQVRLATRLERRTDARARSCLALTIAAKLLARRNKLTR